MARRFERTAPRRERGRLLAGLALACAVLGGEPGGASAQDGPRLPSVGSLAAKNPNAQLLLKADQIQYDYDNESVAAVGNVQIYYEGSTLEADRVVYNQKTGRVQAEGNVRLTEPSGNVIYSDRIDLADNLREGFVASLKVETPDRTRFASTSAERVDENITVFRKGVYTACEPCRENPAKPPFWQVKAARIIYDQKEKMIYYKDAQVEFFGVPIAYFPFFSHPDPNAGRRSGFLQPTFGYSENLGVSVTTPYYFSLAPNYDLTVSPTAYSEQGLLGKGEFRHRLINGSYAIRGAGIFQLSPENFGYLDSPVDSVPSPGNTQARGYLQSNGDFAINDWWNFGWDGALLSDRTFVRNYSLVPAGTTEIISKAYVTGLSERSFFDARVLQFQTLAASEDQDVLPTVHPLVDYNKVYENAVLGGQVSFDMNLTSLTRDDVSAITLQPGTAAERTFFKGLPGNANRVSTKTEWERTLTDPLGQVYTPFAYLRTDAFWYNLEDEFVPESLRGEGEFVMRSVPALGVDYRYPLLSAHSWGTQVIEPVGQVVARTNEQDIGRTPNEDAQSLVYDDTNLFRRDKFSGFDRTEGGVRANVGVSYTVASDSGASANVLFGQSHHLAGRNSFEDDDPQLGLGIDSGLDTDTADYVGRIIFEPLPSVSLVTRFRVDQEDLTSERIEAGAQFTRGPIAASLIYADLDAQPNLGYDSPRQEVVASAGVRLNEFWRVSASGRYDIETDDARSASLGLVYEDECFTVGLTYVGQYFTDEDAEPDDKILVQLNFRTLGGTTFSQSLRGENGPLSSPR